MANTKEDWRKKYRPYIVAATFAFVMTMFVAPEKADGVAMSPTINDGEVIVVYKERFSAKRGTPDYNDVVCFIEDFIKEGEKGEQSISRIVGLPGDEIRIEKKGIYRNDKLIDGSLPYRNGGKNNTPVKLKLSKDEVFVLGDNGEDAIDSRDPRVGALTMDKIKGTCIVRIWPMNKLGRIK